MLRLWVRPQSGAALAEQPRIEAVAGQGVRGDHAFGRKRHVTLVFEDDWTDAAATLGLDVDPAGRRANVLLSGGDGGRLVGHTIRIGEVVIDVKGVAAPCPVMDEAAHGMQEALKPAARSGVWGRILAGGAIVPGDELRIDA